MPEPMIIMTFIDEGEEGTLDTILEVLRRDDAKEIKPPDSPEPEEPKKRLDTISQISYTLAVG